MVWRTADGTADGTVSEAAGPRVRSPPCAPSDASHAAGSDLSGAQHEPETPTAQDLAVSAGDVVINRPNQVWCADITYIPMRRGFLYLVAIMAGSAARFLHGGSQTAWMRRSALKH